MATTITTDVKRTSSGLVEALFDVIDKLNNKEIDAEHARAVSHTARSIVQIARLELEYRKDEQQLVSLQIDAKPKSK